MGRELEINEHAAGMLGWRSSDGAPSAGCTPDVHAIFSEMEGIERGLVVIPLGTPVLPVAA